MWGFLDPQEGLPPSNPRSSVYVMRNGRYEPQNLMPVMPRPDILDFDGFVLRRGPNRGRAAARPPDLKQSTLVKNPASIRKNSLRVIVATSQRSEGGAEEGTVEISFKFDAIRPGKMSIFTNVVEVEHDDTVPGGQVQRRIEFTARPSGAEAGSETLPTATAAQEVHYEAGLGQAFTSRALKLPRLDEELLCYDCNRPREIPIAVQMVADAEEKSTSVETAAEDSTPQRSIHYTYVSLQKSVVTDETPSKAEAKLWSGQLIFQKMEHAGQCFVLYEVFGAGPKDRSGDGEGKDANQDFEGNPDCVICLSEPRDTAVLPCRHMCFCSYCAGIVRLQCDRCPVCRQKVQSLLQFKREDSTQTANTAEAPKQAGYPKAKESEVSVPA